MSNIVARIRIIRFMEKYLGGSPHSTKLHNIRAPHNDQHNVVSSTPRLSWIRTSNVSGDRH